MFNHPNLDPAIVAAINKAEKDGGVDLNKLETGTKLEVHTRNSIYKIEVLDYLAPLYMIQGNGSYYQQPQRGWINGSTFGGGSMLKISWIGVGMCIEMQHPGYEGLSGRVLSTSRVKNIHVIAHDDSWDYVIGEDE